jgi:hypothetical protein
MRGGQGSEARECWKDRVFFAGQEVLSGQVADRLGWRVSKLSVETLSPGRGFNLRAAFARAALRGSARQAVMPP